MSITAGVLSERGTAYSSRTHGFTRNCLLFTNTWVHEELLTLHEHMGSRGSAYSSRTHGFTRNCLLFNEHMGSRGTAYSSRTHGFTRNCLLFTDTWVHTSIYFMGFVLFIFFVLCQILPVSLDCPFSIVESVSHKVLIVQDWVAQTSIKFKSKLDLKCKLIQCTVQVILSVS